MPTSPSVPAKQLRGLNELSGQSMSADLRAAISSFDEYAIARFRVYTLLFAMLWVWMWYQLGPGEVVNTPRYWNYPQSIAVLPWVEAMLALSVGWWIALYTGLLKSTPLMEAIGAIGNVLGVGWTLSISWDLMIFFSCWLPLSCVIIGARYTRRAFYLSLVLAVVIIQVASPHLYWIKRPHFALFALTLTIIMPIMMMRLLNIIRSVTEEAIRSRDAQSRFIATMSHELRSPLNAVVNATELIDTTAMPESQRELVDMLGSNALALRNRVNEVLDVRAIDAGKLAILDEPFTFDGVLKIVQGVVGAQARGKHIALSIRDELGTVILRSDPGRVEQILTNLTANAIKFTPTGGSVEICVRRDDAPVADGRVPVVCTVADSGIGIADDQKDQIFLPFHQASQGATRTHEGVGLGLYIVRQVATLLGGTVVVSDRPGGGSVFTWTNAFAVAASDEKPTQVFDLQQAVAAHRMAVAPMHCLVVDDNPSNRDIARRLLELAGHSMLAVNNGKEALVALTRGSYDTVLLDLHMAAMSGFDVLGALRNAPNEALRSVPVVMVSADADPSVIEAAKNLGASGYLLKPLSFGKLLAMLAELDRRRRGAGASDPGLMGLVSSEEQRSVTPLDIIRAAGGEDGVRDFVALCAEGMDAHLERLYRALNRRDNTDALSAAHALKNEFLNVGYGEGAQACSELREAFEHGTADILARRLGSMMDAWKVRWRLGGSASRVREVETA